MEKHVLVTGATGFIGSHVAETLLKQGVRVTGIDDMNNYYPVANKELNLKILSELPGFKFLPHDITFKDLLKSLVQKNNITHIAHLAARAGVRASIENPELYAKTNVLGTIAVLEAARAEGIKNVVITSSSSVYGENDVPFREDASMTSRPVSPYAASKKAAEVFAFNYHHMYGIPISVVRPFTVYGPRGRPDMAPWLFVEAALKGNPIKKFGDGTTKRDYTFIDDFVKGFISALDNPQENYEIFNLGNSKTVSLNRFIEVVQAKTGKSLQIIPEEAQAGDVPITCADISKARDLLGYNPQTNIEEGMKRFVEWYKSEHL